MDGSEHTLPWQRVLERVECLRNDPSCRQGLIVHAVILGIVLLLVAFRRFLFAQDLTALSLNARKDVQSEGGRLVSHAQIDSIIVYPIKSCAGLRLDKAFITKKGLVLDRRWMVIKRGKADAEWQKISLREESKLTLVQPAIEEDGLRLSISCFAKSSKPALPSIKIPLSCKAGAARVRVAMWGDAADARIVDETVDSAQWSSTPSQWLSQFLGYEVKLIQFDSEGVSREAFPLYKPPVLAKGDTLEELRTPRGIEFQDEYPLLIATLESLDDLQEQIREATFALYATDRRGGLSVAGKLFEPANWRDKILQSTQAAEAVVSDDSKTDTQRRRDWLNIQRFRPNIVLRSCASTDKPSIKAWEEDFWTKLEFRASSGSPSNPGSKEEPAETSAPATTIEMHLVSRCQRCLLTTVDPTTAERDVSVPLAFLRRSRNQVKKVPLDEKGLPKQGDEKGKPGPCFGMYAVVPEGRGGEVSIGDDVTCFWANNTEQFG